MSGMRGRVLKDTAVVFTGNSLSAAMGFVTAVLLARTMSPTEFGLLSPMVSILEISQIFMNTVIGSSMLLFVSKHLESNPAKAEMGFKIGFWLRMAAALCISSIGFLGADKLSKMFYGNCAMSGQLRLCFVAVMGVALYTASQSVLQVRRQFLRLAVVTLYKNAMRVIAVVVLVAFGWLSVVVTVKVYVVVAFLSALVALFSVSHAYLARPGFDRDTVREMFATNRWMFLLLILFVVGSRLDIFMLASLSEPLEVGRYTAAFQLSSSLALLGQALITTLLPEIAGFRARDRMFGFLRTYLKLFVLLPVPIVLILFLGPWLFPLVMGPQYVGDGTLFNLLAMTTVITVASNPALMVLFPMGQAKVLALGVVMQIGLRIPLNLIYIPRYGATAAASSDLVSKVISVVVMLGLAYYLLMRETGPLGDDGVPVA